MNNKPVAWIPKGMTLAKPKDLTDCIPLYTHPVNLTDEEIENVYQSLQLEDYIRKQDCIDFARAILRKAQQ